MLTFDLEMTVNPDLRKKSRYKGYLRQLAEAERRRNVLMRIFILFDVAAILFVSGSKLSSPLFGVRVSDLPIALEVLTLVASLAFLFFAVSFVNWHAYTAIVEQYAVSESKRNGGDPDFATSADRFNEFFIKIFRPKMNIWNYDFFEATPVPARLFVFMLGFIQIVFLCFLAMHLWAIVQSLSISWVSLNSSFRYPYVAFIASSNIAALAFLLILHVPFTFIEVMPAATSTEAGPTVAPPKPQRTKPRSPAVKNASRPRRPKNANSSSRSSED